MSSAASSTKIAPKVPAKSRIQRRTEREYIALCEKSSFILPSTTFKRLVAQTTKEFGHDYRYNKQAVEAIQSAAESELTAVFTGSAMCARMSGRETISVQDMKNFQALRNM